MKQEYKVDEKKDIDQLIDLVKRGDWKAQNFLYLKSRDYCYALCSKKDWTVSSEDLKEMINFSVGKAISKYEICGRYWGLLSAIFVNDVIDIYFKPIYDKKKLMEELLAAVNNPFEKADYDPTRKEILMQFLQALSRKSDEQQKCIQLVLEGFNDEEIKTVLDTNKSIKDLKYHAKMNLKRVLVDDLGWQSK